jgi:hypothetical protein
LSFKTKVPGILGLTGQQKVIKKGFRDLVDEGVRALEASTAKRMSVHMTRKVAAHQIFLNLLTDSFQQMLKLHRIMDAQF